MNKVVVSPVTRLSGFYKIEIIVDSNNKVVDAFSSGTLFRGFESMLLGRSPEDAIYYTQRICGICSTSHSIASSRTIENASKVQINEQAQFIRDIIHGFDILQNHLRSFYIFSIPDYIDIPITNYINNPDLRIPKELSDKIILNYEKALEISRLAHEGVSLFGGKVPHNHGVVFGGVSSNVDSIYLGRASDILGTIEAFIINSMLPDYKIIEEYYGDYLYIGASVNNFMSFGLFNEFPEVEISPPRVIYDGVKALPYYENIIEDTSNIHPNNKNQYEYNFIKAPRYQGLPMEVGPLSRAVARGEHLNSSTLNRIQARVYECLLVCRALRFFLSKLITGRNYPIGTVNDGIGTGYVDTIRGSLLHHVEILDKKIKHYDIITPSAWNLSPHDTQNAPGPLEAALINTKIKTLENPIELIRTIHSFDPCISCATHIYKKNGEMVNAFHYLPW